MPDCDEREAEPIPSFDDPLRDENKLSLAKREDSELQLTSATAAATVNARRDRGSERFRSATQRMGPLTRQHTPDERVKQPRVNKFLTWKRSLNPNRSWPNC